MAAAQTRAVRNDTAAIACPTFAASATSTASCLTTNGEGAQAAAAGLRRCQVAVTAAAARTTTIAMKYAAIGR